MDTQSKTCRIGILGHSVSQDLPECLESLVTFCQKKNLEILLEPALLKYAPENIEELDLEKKRVDFLIALGGDGTLLRAGRMASGMNIPVLGVNLGHLGFLTALPKNDLEGCLQQIIDGDYVLDVRSMLDAQIVHEDGSEGEPLLAWNDFVIHKSGLASVTRLGLRIKKSNDWNEMGSFAGDGLVVGTPTGSTAYSLSAGGPIVDPSVECFLVTPICPHTLNIRPMIIPGSSKVAVDSVERAENLVLTADGQVALDVPPGSTIYIKQSEINIHLVRFPGQNFFDTLRHKLNWAGESLG